MQDCEPLLDPLNNYDSEAQSATSAYNLLLLLGGLTVATYALVQFAESRNRLNYESRLARIVAGFLILLTRMMHTSGDDLNITSGKKIIAAGPHQTTLEAFVLASKITGAPPQFLATDFFNFVPGVASFMRMFKTIQVPSHRTKDPNGRSSNQVLELGNKALNEDGCVALFPQGNFSRIGQKPPRVYSGAAKLALMNNIPIHVVRLDGFWCMQNPLIPISIRNHAYYRAFLSLFHMNNVRTTLCCIVDYHLQPENAHQSDEEKINEICAQLYAYFRHTQDLSPEEISAVKTEIAEKKHLLIWNNKVKEDDAEKSALLSSKAGNGLVPSSPCLSLRPQ